MWEDVRHRGVSRYLARSPPLGQAPAGVIPQAPVPLAMPMVLSLVGCLALSCSHLGSVGLGPAVAHTSGVKRSYGSELRLRHGAGSSDGEGVTLLEVEGRAAVTERVSAISSARCSHWSSRAPSTRTRAEPRSRLGCC